MESCQRCGSTRVVSISAKCSDLCFAAMSGDREHTGYVPYDIGIGGGDYVDMIFCLDCGQIEGEFPLPVAEIEGIS